MNTLTKSASTNVIVAVDLGKYKSVGCVLDPATGEYRFTTFDTTRAELRKLVAKEQPAVAVIEACLLAGSVHDLYVELGMRCLVANTPPCGRPSPQAKAGAHSGTGTRTILSR